MTTDKKIILRRSKIDAWQNLVNHRANRKAQSDTPLGKDMDWQFEQAEKAMVWRMIVAINSDFTVEENHHTINFVQLFNNEEYDKLVIYEIDENN